MDSLCSNMLSDHEQLRDISSIGEYAQGLVSFCCFCCFMFKMLSLYVKFMGKIPKDVCCVGVV